VADNADEGLKARRQFCTEAARPMGRHATRSNDVLTESDDQQQPLVEDAQCVSDQGRLATGKG
jgi:hypothetical protein